MKHDKSSQPDPQDTRHSRVNRRRFLSGVAIGAGLAPLAALSSSLRARGSAAAATADALCVGPTTMSPTDLSYLGAISLPADTQGARFGYSFGALTGRIVNGRTRLFITGSMGGRGDNNNVLNAVYEVELNGMNRASFIRNWGDVTQGRMLVRDGANGVQVRGLLYNTSDGYLYVAYGDTYMTSQPADPSVIAAKLNDSTGAVQSFGPWRTGEHSQKTRGFMTPLPADVAGGRTIGIGGPIQAQNGFGPRGAVLFALDPFNPATTTPATRTDTTVNVRNTRLIYSDINQPQVRDANYKICGFNTPNDPSSGGWIMPGDPTWNNRGRDDLALDRLDAVAWVRTASVEGVVFFGQMTMPVPGVSYASDTVPHIWYGPANTTCPHGQPSRTEGTGPKSGSMAPVMLIFDRSKLNPSKAPVPTSTTRLTAPVLPQNATNDAVFGGAWFDGTDTLYVSAANAVMEDEPRPVILAYKVRV